MELQMEMCNCAKCGISFAIPTAVQKRLRECHNEFFCPMGHSNYYPHKTEAESLREALSNKDIRISELLIAVEEKSKEIKKIKKTQKATGVNGRRKNDATR
jgi:hypothetical protein